MSALAPEIRRSITWVMDSCKGSNAVTPDERRQPLDFRLRAQ